MGECVARHARKRRRENVTGLHFTAPAGGRWTPLLPRGNEKRDGESIGIVRVVVQSSTRVREKQVTRAYDVAGKGVIDNER